MSEWARSAPLLRIDQREFVKLIAELARRGRGRRESGAFLLARAEADTNGPVRITRIVFYDDLDPHSLTGGIEFGAAGYSNLNALCRSEALRVAGDVHTHPGRFVAQSGIDATHPMIGLRGHVALIAPNFARGSIGPADLGVHLYDVGGWTSYFGSDAAAALELTGRPGLVAGARRLVALASAAAARLAALAGAARPSRRGRVR